MSDPSPGISATQDLRQALRNEMPIAQNYAYFDHAAVSPLPKRTAERVAQFLHQATHQGDTMWPEWSAASERTRASAAQLLSCDRSEIALVPNTTFGISTIAEGLPWQPGENVVVPENEFPSNLVPWRNLARKGVELRLVPVGLDGSVMASDFEPLIDRRTRLVSVSWIGFSSGYRCCLSEIVELAHSRQCLVLLDAIQGLGAFPLNVSTLPIDFVAADGHKWMLGPEGAGLLYIRKQHLDRLQPLHVGWNSLKGAGFDPKSLELKCTAARYEGGSINMMGMLGFGCSLDLLLDLGCNRTDSHIRTCILENVDELQRELQSANFTVDVPENADHRSGILGVRWNDQTEKNDGIYQQARKYLLDRNIVVSVRGGKIRVSTHAYNDRQDRYRLVEALLEFRHHNH